MVLTRSQCLTNDQRVSACLSIRTDVVLWTVCWSGRMKQRLSWMHRTTGSDVTDSSADQPITDLCCETPHCFFRWSKCQQCLSIFISILFLSSNISSSSSSSSSGSKWSIMFSLRSIMFINAELLRLSHGVWVWCLYRTGPVKMISCDQSNQSHVQKTCN